MTFETAEYQFSFDSECLALAEHFLANAEFPETKKDCHELAQAIQDCIEQWLDYREREERD